MRAPQKLQTTVAADQVKIRDGRRTLQPSGPHWERFFGPAARSPGNNRLYVPTPKPAVHRSNLLWKTWLPPPLRKTSPCAPRGGERLRGAVSPFGHPGASGRDLRGSSWYGTRTEIGQRRLRNRRTCIYRQNAPPEREMTEESVRDPYIGFKGYCIGQYRDDACCRAFWNRQKDEFAAGQIARRPGRLTTGGLDRTARWRQE